MKKIELELSNLLYQKAMLPIRRKDDLLKLLAHTIKFLVLHRSVDTTTIALDKKLILYLVNVNMLYRFHMRLLTSSITVVKHYWCLSLSLFFQIYWTNYRNSNIINQK